jgi:hypothetical protein
MCPRTSAQHCKLKRPPNRIKLNRRLRPHQQRIDEI